MKLRLSYFLPLLGFGLGWLASSRPPGVLLQADTYAPSSLNAAIEHAPVSAAKPQVRALLPTPETFRKILAIPSYLHCLSALDELMQGMTSAQFAALKAEMGKGRRIDPYFLKLFYDRWARVDPEAALASVGQTGSMLAAYTVLYAWAEKDPEAALAGAMKADLALDINPDWLRATITTKRLSKLLELPPREALARLREQSATAPADSIETLTTQLFENWAKNDADSAWSKAVTLGGPREVQARILKTIIAAAVQKDMATATRLISLVPDGLDRKPIEAAYISALVNASQGVVAQNYVLSMPEGSARVELLITLSDVLTRPDSGAAERLFANLTASDLRDPSRFSFLFNRWLIASPERATEALLSHLPTNSEITPEQLKRYDEIVSGFTYHDQTLAAGLIERLPEPIRNQGRLHLAERWTQTDPKAAASWALTLPDSKDAVLEKIAVNWTRAGSQGVTQWLDSLPSGPGRSAAVEGFAKSIISVKADDALAWIRSVPNEKERLDRLERVWKNWGDRAAAENWARTSAELTSSERKRLVP